MAIAGIYKITNLKNNKIYIGESIDILNRWKEHLTNAFSKNQIEYNYPLQTAIREDGINNFSFEILETELYDNLKRKEREHYYIDYFNTCVEGYNQNKGFEINKNTARRLWTDAEIELLRQLISEGLSYEEIGIRMDRTSKSINTKASKLGIGLRVNNPWTKEKEEEMLSLRNQKYSQLEASKILGFSKEALKKRWHDVYSYKEGDWRIK